MATRRLYYDDSFERDFEAQLLRCEPVMVDSPLMAPAWGVVLDRTLFYPTSGGQPHDLGLLGAAKVLDVRDEGLARIFAEAATSNAVLFFDEADALFGKRSEVRD